MADYAIPTPASAHGAKLSPARRRRLRVAGSVLTLAGVFLVGYGFYRFITEGASSVQGGSGPEGPLSGFLMFALGGPILVVGFVLLYFGYLRVLSGITATEGAPATEVAAGALGRGLAAGLREGLGGDPFGGARPDVRVRCRACGFLETDGAKFCSNCRTAM